MADLASTTDRLDYLGELLREVHGDIDAAREEEGWTAVSRLASLALTIRNEMDKLREDRAVASGLPVSELAARLAEAIRALPSEHLPVIAEALASRSG